MVCRMVANMFSNGFKGVAIARVSLLVARMCIGSC